MRAGMRAGYKINHYSRRGYILLAIAIVKQAVKDAKEKPELYKSSVIRFLKSDSCIISLAGLKDTDCSRLVNEINAYKKKTAEEKKAEKEKYYSQLSKQFGIYPEDFETRQQYISAIYAKKRRLERKKEKRNDNPAER